MADVPYPYFGTAQDTQNWLDVQRKQQIAQMLMGSLQQANQTPANWDSMKVVPKRGAVQNLSVLADALLARKGLDSANQSIANYMNPQQPFQSQPYDESASAQAPPGIAAPPPGPGSPTNTPTAGLVPGSQDTVMGIPRAMAAQVAKYPGGMEAILKQGMANYTPLEVDKLLDSAGIGRNSPQGLAIKQAALAKQSTNVQDVRPGSTLFDLNDKNPIFTAPDNGVNTTWANGQPAQAPIQGGPEAIQAVTKAKTTGSQTATPIKLGTDENGKDIYGYPAPPGPGTPNATAPSVTASAAQIESQRAGAKAGQDYASELAKNAAGATEVRRSLSELKNLSAQATPSAANEAKAKLGAFMIAAGANPDTVQRWVGVDIAAIQAAQKQTATLAVNKIHSMTSRGTNFDLDTFMRNNPNMNMADPEAFGRVADYMDKQASQDIAKQKDFAQWKKSSGESPDNWETAHTAHWLEKQNQEITAGQSNSANPNAPKPSLADLQAEARRRGLIK